MSALQIAAVTTCMLLLGIDGFDVLAISFAAPGISAEWGIDRAALGIVLSMELVGMSLGSVLLGAAADRFGRRPTILGCLALMCAGMFMVTRVATIHELELWRVTTGVGIGGLLATCNAVAAEFSNLRRRDLSVSVMAVVLRSWPTCIFPNLQRKCWYGPTLAVLSEALHLDCSQTGLPSEQPPSV